MAAPSRSPTPSAPAPLTAPDYQARLAQEWESFKTPPTRDVAAPPKVGDKAPVHENLKLPADKPVIIVFLRHCGCPIAEKVFRTLTHYSTQHPDVHFVAVSHSSAEATERWVIQVGGNWDVEVVIDEERELYARWGLGVSSTWHVFSPVVLYRTLQLGKQEHIWNRPTESGSRWQTAGAFALDRPVAPAAAAAADVADDAADTDADARVVCWAHVAATAADVPDLVQALAALGVKAKPWPPRPAEPQDY